MIQTIRSCIAHFCLWTTAGMKQSLQKNPSKGFGKILRGKTDRKEMLVEMRRKLDLFGLISLSPAGWPPPERNQISVLTSTSPTRDGLRNTSVKV